MSTMNIYDTTDPETIVDIYKAADELRASGGITNSEVRRAAVAEIQAAALLDIAGSLRVLAIEALSAMPEQAEAASGEPVQDERDRDFLIEGDIVSPIGNDDFVGQVESFGVSEGATYANVVWEDGARGRAWLEQLNRVITAESDADVKGRIEDGLSLWNTAEPADVKRRNDSAGLEPEAAEFSLDDLKQLVDDEEEDVDDDFEPSALDALKATEAERKAKKKGGKK
jgi:hypothetical protein